ncbi:MAG TPA: hypothetical protein VGP68_09195 [Gemmataceae bacterium]|jgi:hypothetical protein|nr:hypothetical protein [Gemmataceae bacterium]
MTNAAWFLLLPLILPFVAPARLARRFRGIEHVLRAAARRPILSALIVGFASFCVGPLVAHYGQWPYPTIHDEFSYLLASDTFAHGRVTNPPHRLWQHFESMHILLQPTYASKYPPAQGLFLALGQVLFGMPIVGVWLNNALATLAAIWMLRGWMPYRWAIFGGFLMGAHPLMIAWGQCYWGGSAAVLGGCLLVGAWPRVAKHRDVGAAFLGAAGIAILANSRPYEGLVLTVAIGGCQAVSWLRSRAPGIVHLLLGAAGPLAAVLILTAVCMAYLNYRVTGHVDRLPYQEHAQQYATVPPFLWEKPYPEPEYRHAELKQLYADWEAESYREQRTFAGFLAGCRDKFVVYFNAAFSTPLMLLSLLAAPWILRSRRYRPAVLVLVLFTLALMPETFLQQHYAAPAAGLVNLLCVQGLRYIRCLRRPRAFVGRSLVRLAFVLSLVSTGLYVAKMEQDLAGNQFMIQRMDIEKRVRAVRGNHLVIVKYGKEHNIHEEWVYNGADIDHSRIIWARDMGEKDNQALERYYHDRHIWQLIVGAVPGGTRLVELGPLIIPANRKDPGKR